MKKLTLFGSTGSVGRMTLEVIEKFPEDFSIHALVAYSSKELLLEQALKYKPEVVVLYDPQGVKWLKNRVGCRVLTGSEGLIDVTYGCDLVVQAMSSTTAVEATINALKRNIPVAIANKETIIAAHRLIAPYLHLIRPIDSEHSSLAKLFEIDAPTEIYITASGGPFLKKDLSEFKDISVKEALHHPNWAMGAVNTVNSSTLFNKVLEVFEAFYLFKQIPKILIEPTSRVHAVATYKDGMTHFLAYPPDMRLPILHALNDEKKYKFPFTKPLSFSPIEFFDVDPNRFPLTSLIVPAMEKSCGPAFLMFYNELLLEDFFKGRLSWLHLQEKLVEAFADCPNMELDSIAAIEELKNITKRIYQCNILQSSMA